MRAIKFCALGTQPFRRTQLFTTYSMCDCTATAACGFLPSSSECAMMFLVCYSSTVVLQSQVRLSWLLNARVVA